MPKIYEVYGEAIKKGKEHGVLSNDLRILIAHDMGSLSTRFTTKTRR